MTTFLRRHWVLLTLLSLGVVLRVIVQVAYQPAILYIDSFSYLSNTDVQDVDPRHARPLGYSVLLLSWLLPFRELALVPFVQHLLGLGMAVAIYAVLVRHEAPPWLSALATTPVLLDGYQLQIEQNIMADTLFQALIVAAFAALLWRKPRSGTIVFAGLLLGLATTVRLVGVLLIAVVLAYVLLSFGPDLRRRLHAAALVAAFFAVPVTAYGVWYLGGDRGPGTGAYQGKVLYGRVAPFADCAKLADEPRRIRELCPREPLGQREGVDHYIYSPASPANRVGYGGTATNGLLRSFAWKVAVNQPFHFAGAVTSDFAKGFAPVRSTMPGDVPLERWRFQETYPVYEKGAPYRATARYDGDTKPYVHPTLSGFLRGYQDVVYTRGPLLATGMLLGLAAGLGRARGTPQGRASLLIAASGTGLILVPAFIEFSWRYQLPAIVLLPWAGVLGATAWLRNGRTSSSPPVPTSAGEQVGS